MAEVNAMDPLMTLVSSLPISGIFGWVSALSSGIFALGTFQDCFEPESLPTALGPLPIAPFVYVIGLLVCYHLFFRAFVILSYLSVSVGAPAYVTYKTLGAAKDSHDFLMLFIAHMVFWLPRCFFLFVEYTLDCISFSYAMVSGFLVGLLELVVIAKGKSLGEDVYERISRVPNGLYERILSSSSSFLERLMGPAPEKKWRGLNIQNPGLSQRREAITPMLVPSASHGPSHAPPQPARAEEPFDLIKEGQRMLSNFL